MRSGWPTALYVRGISLGRAWRCGRWKSGTSRRYLYRDNKIYRFAGAATIQAIGLLGQLQMATPKEYVVTFGVDEDDDMDDEFPHRTGRGSRRNTSDSDGDEEASVNHAKPDIGNISEKSEWNEGCGWAESVEQVKPAMDNTSERGEDEVGEIRPLEMRWRPPGSIPGNDSDSDSMHGGDPSGTPKIAAAGEEVRKSDSDSAPGEAPICTPKNVSSDD